MAQSIFDLTSPADCSIFAPLAGAGTDQFVSFVRSTLRFNTTLQQPRLNSSGETQLSYASSGTFLVSLQPRDGTYVRFVQGVIAQVDYTGVIIGDADIIEGDRCTINNRRLECINAIHWGTEQTEISLRYLGR